MNEQEIKAIAHQLARPEGELGEKVGGNMDQSNRPMSEKGILGLELKTGETVLELGHGMAGHLDFLMEQASGLLYQGLELSQLMQTSAHNANEHLVKQGLAKFRLYDGQYIPFEQAMFDKVLTVNTVYFWEEPQALFLEIFRVLKPGGWLSLVFAQKRFMKQLPFTAYGFTLYDTQELVNLAEQAGLGVHGVNDYTDHPQSKTSEAVTREFTVLTLRK